MIFEICNLELHYAKIDRPSSDRRAAIGEWLQELWSRCRLDLRLQSYLFEKIWL